MNRFISTFSCCAFVAVFAGCGGAVGPAGLVPSNVIPESALLHLPLDSSRVEELCTDLEPHGEHGLRCRRVVVELDSVRFGYSTALYAAEHGDGRVARVHLLSWGPSEGDFDVASAFRAAFEGACGAHIEGEGWHISTCDGFIVSVMSPPSPSSGVSVLVTSGDRRRDRRRAIDVAVMNSAFHGMVVADVPEADSEPTNDPGE